MACFIKKCKSRMGRKEKNCEYISFHRFPNDEILRQKWMDVVPHEMGWTPKNHHRICSKHFELECFTINESNERRELKKCAIPTLHLGSNFPVSPSTTLNVAKLQNSFNALMRRNHAQTFKSKSYVNPLSLSKTGLKTEISSDIVDKLKVTCRQCPKYKAKIEKLRLEVLRLKKLAKIRLIKIHLIQKKIQAGTMKNHNTPKSEE